MSQTVKIRQDGRVCVSVYADDNIVTFLECDEVHIEPMNTSGTPTMCVWMHTGDACIGHLYTSKVIMD